MSNNYLPDLGTLFSKFFDMNQVHHFYSIPIGYIIYVDSNLYCTSLEYVYNNELYCSTFDFNGDRLRELLHLDKHPDYLSYEKRDLKVIFDGFYRVDFPDHPIIVNIAAKLGKLTKGQFESFIPFKVKKFGKIIEAQTTKTNKRPTIISGCHPIELIVCPRPGGTGIMDLDKKPIQHSALMLPNDLSKSILEWHKISIEQIEAGELEIHGFYDRGIELAEQLKSFLRKLARVYVFNQEVIINNYNEPECKPIMDKELLKKIPIKN